MVFKFPATPLRIGVILMMAFIIMGCAATSSPASLPPTSFSPTITHIAATEESPTPCFGGYTWAYGSVSPEFITMLEDAMAASGLEGSAQASTFGEDDGCGEYHAMAVDYVFTVNVESLEANEDLASKASAVLDIAQRFVDLSPAPNLGKLQLTFQSGGRGCHWGYESGAWNFISGNIESGSACQIPTTAEAERLAEVLTGLSVDLACETSSVVADTRRATLECERPEGDDTYIVNVTFHLSGQGYDGACFHGYKAFESSMTGDEPMTVTEGSATYYERDRSFQWGANGMLFELRERIMGGPDVTLPSDLREKVYQRLVGAGVIPGDGSDCR